MKEKALWLGIKNITDNKQINAFFESKNNQTLFLKNLKHPQKLHWKIKIELLMKWWWGSWRI